MTQLDKNPTIGGIKFKTVSVCNRPMHIAQMDGPEISIAYSDTERFDNGQELGWYWDKRGVGTSRTPAAGASYGTYFNSPEEAFAAALEA